MPLSKACRRAAVVIFLTCSFLLCSSSSATAADFGGYRPHYQGFGVKTRGGRGGTIYRVTRLEDDINPGSLRHALLASGPRFVIFEVSGPIALRSSITITSPFLTIAGQTAPSPGILIRDGDVRVSTHDVVIQHLRFRLGDRGIVSNADSLGLRCDVRNVVLDHVSISWGVDESLVFHRSGCPGERPKEISVFDSIISETLMNSINDTGAHSRAFLIGANPDGTATVARNLLANNYERNPTVQPGWRVMWLNNVTYNAGVKFIWYLGGLSNGTSSSELGDGNWPYEVVHVGNVATPGPSTNAGLRTVAIQTVPSTSRFYLADNVGLGMTPSNQWAGVELRGGNTESQLKLSSPPSWFTLFGITPMPSAAAEAYVLANAGARPLDRDSVDARIVQEVKQRTGKIINSQNEVGGWPTLARQKRALILPADPHRVVDAAGRTVVEAWLETFALDLEPSSTLAGSTRPEQPRNLRLLH